MPKDLKEPDIVKIVNDGVVPRLDDLRSGARLQRQSTAAALPQRTPKFRSPTSRTSTFQTMAKFSEHDVGLPGVDIAIKPVRSYVYGALAAHLLGYVGAPDDTNQARKRRSTRFIRATWRENRTSRKSMDEYLRGKPGVRYLRRNAKGAIDGVVREEPPQQGANVYLTLDARIQSIAEEALRAVSRAGGSRGRSEQRQHSGDGIGAVIRSEHIHSEHQSERLEGAAERRRRSAREPRDQRTAAGLDL